jgi:hypothetical protein
MHVCILLDDRIPLSKDTVADALFEDKIFYRSDTPGSVDESDSSSPTSSPGMQDPSPVAIKRQLYAGTTCGRG